MLGVKEVISKKRSVYDEFCTICQEFLGGNGSIVYPWTCGCGTYTFEWGSNGSGWTHPKSKEQPDA